MGKSSLRRNLFLRELIYLLCKISFYLQEFFIFYIKVICHTWNENRSKWKDQVNVSQEVLSILCKVGRIEAKKCTNKEDSSRKHIFHDVH